jgi:hypothetical protein
MLKNTQFAYSVYNYYVIDRFLYFAAIAGHSVNKLILLSAFKHAEICNKLAPTYAK